jgi:hypothetical protein
MVVVMVSRRTLSMYLMKLTADRTPETKQTANAANASRDELLQGMGFLW